MEKTLDYPVPFFSNTQDNTHCFQAALKMILEYFLPEQNFSWKKLDKITAKEPEVGTWPLAGMIWMQTHGFEVLDLETFDYPRFIKEKGQYILDLYSKEAGTIQIKNTNFPKEIKQAKIFTKTVKIEQIIPELKDIQRLLQQKYLLLALINYQKIIQLTGYIPHFVVIKGSTGKNLIIHDPGLPALKNRKVNFELFDQAWADPDKNARNLMAFKPAKKN